MKKFFTDTKYAISWGILGAVAVAVCLVVYLLSITVSEFKYWSDGDTYKNSISVKGEAEVIAIPDIAKLSFSINETSEGSESAQKSAQEKLDAVTKYLTEQGVAKEDIKTESFNIYPKYEWINMPCNEFGCQGQNNLVGYTVDHFITVKIKDTAKAGEIVNGITSKGVNNISGLQFTTEDETVLLDEARTKAIADAKARAEVIAKDLGVKLGDIIGFYETPEDEYFPRPAYGMGGDIYMKDAAVEIPVGQDLISSRVEVIFEIK